MKRQKVKKKKASPSKETEFYREVLAEEEDIPDFLKIADKCLLKCEKTKKTK